jgi:hypothetical protein
MIDSLRSCCPSLRSESAGEIPSFSVNRIAIVDTRYLCSSTSLYTYCILQSSSVFNAALPFNVVLSPTQLAYSEIMSFDHALDNSQLTFSSTIITCNMLCCFSFRSDPRLSPILIQTLGTPRNLRLPLARLQKNLGPASRQQERRGVLEYPYTTIHTTVNRNNGHTERHNHGQRPHFTGQDPPDLTERRHPAASGHRRHSRLDWYVTFLDKQNKRNATGSTRFILLSISFQPNSTLTLQSQTSNATNSPHWSTAFWTPTSQSPWNSS